MKYLILFLISFNLFAGFRTDTITLSESLILDGSTIEYVATGSTVNNYIATKGYIDDKDALNIPLTFDGETITGLATGTGDNDKLATKGYADESGFASPMTTDGDIIIQTGGSAGRLAVGDESKVLKVSGGLPSWEVDAGGVGDVDTYQIINAELPYADLTYWSTAGLTNATLTVNSTTPLFGIYDFSFGNVTGSASESVITTNVAIPNGSAGRSHGVTLNYSYDGIDNDIRLEFVDVTNSVTIGSPLLLPAGTNQKKQIIGFTNSTTANVALKAIINNVNDGKFLKMDNIKFEVDPQKTVQINQENVFTARIEGNDGSPEVLDQKPYDFIDSITDGGVGVYTINFKAGVFGVAPKMIGAIVENDESYVWVNGVISTTAAPLIVYRFSGAGTDSNLSVAFQKTGTDYKETVEGVVHSNTYPENVYGANIAADAVVTNENDNFLTTCTDADPRVCTLVTGFFTVAPRCWASPTAGTAIVTASSTTEVTIDTTDANTAFGLFCQRQGTDYKPLTGTVITPPSQTCYLRDTQTSGDNGGSSSANTVHVRTINTANGDCSFLTQSYSGGAVTIGKDGNADQFTLGVGKYNIKGCVAAYITNQTQAFLYGVTDVDYIINGRSEFSGDAGGQQYVCFQDTITIAVPKTYQVRHWTASANADDGLGFKADTNASNPQDYETYVEVEIEKLK